MPVAPQPPATKPGGRGGQAHEFFGVNEGELTTIDGAAPHGETAGRLTAALLVAALTAGALQQGGFFERGQVSVAALLAAALVSALPIDRASEPTLRLALAAGVLAAGWALIRAFPGGSLRAAASEAFLLTALGVVVALTRRLDEPGRRLAVAGVLGVGVVLAATAWIGVVWRVTPWGLTSAGLWRGASTITYANATGCLLAVLALTCLALLGRDRRSLSLNVVLTLLLIGLVTTLSRGAALSFVVGLAVLVLLRGTIVLRALAGPLLGTAIASVFLLPSIPVSNQPRPLLGLGGLVIGVALAAAVAAAGRRGTVAMAVAVLAVATVGLTRPGVSPSLDAAGNRLSASRLEVGSPARSRLHETALDLFGSEPLVGVGPGQFRRESKKHGELHVQGYVHDEYAQLLAEQGVIGAALGVVLLISLARVLWKGRLDPPSPVLWASCVASLVAVSVHAGFDFVWHIPLVLICLALLLGLAVKPATSTNEVA